MHWVCFRKFFAISSLEADPTEAILSNKRKITSYFEVIGSVLAMVYSMSIAMNIGAEILGFSLLKYLRVRWLGNS